MWIYYIVLSTLVLESNTLSGITGSGYQQKQSSTHAGSVIVWYYAPYIIQMTLSNEIVIEFSIPSRPAGWVLIQFCLLG